MTKGLDGATNDQELVPEVGAPRRLRLMLKVAVLWAVLLVLFNASPCHMPYMVINIAVLPMALLLAIRWRRWGAVVCAILIATQLQDPWKEFGLGVDEYRKGTARFLKFGYGGHRCFVDQQTGCWVLTGLGCTIPSHEPRNWNFQDSAYRAGVLFMVHFYGKLHLPPPHPEDVAGTPDHAS